jgi:2-succinyl-6-hydroxy-2,4-cyclohexadiene-1-carboxylate synthase
MEDAFIVYHQRDMRFNINDIRLKVETTGTGPALLLLHGFTGSAATWASFLPQFTSRRRAIVVDLIGHGGSDAPPEPARYRMERCVADLAALLDELAVERADVLGYSMGGRVALHLAAAYPERVRSLILESSSPGIADPAERETRAEADDALADAIERDGLAAFADRWERLPLFASQAALPAATRERLHAQRLRNDPRGLANSLRGMGAGQQESLWQRLATLDTPTLLLTGALDTKYHAIATQMAESLPHAQVKIVPGAGHAVHLEQPEVFLDAVLQFLCR